MWVEAHVTFPGLQHGKNTHFATNEPGIAGELQDGFGSTAHQQAINKPLVAAGGRAQFLWKCCCHQKMLHRQQKIALPGQPGGRGLVAALWAASILARMIAVAVIITLFAKIDLTAHDFSATVDNILHRPFMAREHVLAVFLPVGRTAGPEDVGQLRHCCCTGLQFNPGCSGLAALGRFAPSLASR